MAMLSVQRQQPNQQCDSYGNSVVPPPASSPAISPGPPRRTRCRFSKKSRSQEEEDNFDVAALRTGRRSGLLPSIANLAKGALGGGVLAGHVAYMKSGFLSGIILNIIFGVYMCLCFYLVVRCGQTLCRRCQVPYMTYPDIAETSLALFPNPKVAKFSSCFRYSLDFLISLDLFGSCACYQLIVGKTIKQLVEDTSASEIAGHDGLPNLRVYVAIMILPTILICLITELKYLAPFSIVANAFVGFCIILTIYYAHVFNPKFEGLVPFTDFHGQIQYVGMSVFSMSCAGMFMPVENNMKDPKKYPVVIGVGFVFIIGAVFLSAFFGYVAFREHCKSPITINYPMSLFPKIVKGMMGAMIYVTHALNFFLPFNTCFHYIKKCHNPAKWYFWELFYRALIVLTISIVAIVFPTIDALMGFLGSFCLSNIVFIFPPVIYILVSWEHPGLGKFKWRLICAFISIMVGIFILVCGSIVSVNDMLKLFMES